MRFLPISRWSHEFSRSDVLRADLLAGLTGAIVVLPQGIAFSMLAGLPAQFGLYAAMVPCILAALFGSSRAMVTGPANAISLTTMALIAPLATVGSEAYISLVLTLSFLVGVSQCLIGLSGAGKYVDRVPHSVIVGFTVGASVLIINSQLGSLLGMDLARGMSVIGSVERIASEVLAHNLDWHAPALVLVTLFVIALWRPLNKKVPSMLVAVLLGSLVAMLIESIIGGTFRYERVATISEVLPPLTLPDLRAPILNSLVGPALVMLLLASTEAMAIARSVALRRQDTFCANQEFLGQGIANIGGAFFSSYPASGSFNRSGVNVAAGAQTPISAISSAIFLMLILGFVGPLIEFLPKVVISALLLAVAWGLIDLRQIKQEIKAGLPDSLPMMVTAGVTIFFSLEWAIVFGILLAASLKRCVRPSSPR